MFYKFPFTWLRSTWIHYQLTGDIVIWTPLMNCALVSNLLNAWSEVISSYQNNGLELLWPSFLTMVYSSTGLTSSGTESFCTDCPYTDQYISVLLQEQSVFVLQICSCMAAVFFLGPFSCGKERSQNPILLDSFEPLVCCPLQSQINGVHF